MGEAACGERVGIVRWIRGIGRVSTKIRIGLWEIARLALTVYELTQMYRK